MNNGHIYFIQLLFVTGIAIGSQVLTLEDKLKWLNVARYTIYVLTITAIPGACRLTHRLVRGEALALQPAAAAALAHALVYCGSALALLLCDQQIFEQHFVFLFLGYLVAKYPEMMESTESPASHAGSSTGTASKVKTAINYGVGMACSYFEGYLVHILPSDGHKFVGFEENIRALEKHHLKVCSSPTEKQVDEVTLPVAICSCHKEDYSFRRTTLKIRTKSSQADIDI